MHKLLKIKIDKQYNIIDNNNTPNNNSNLNNYKEKFKHNFKYLNNYFLKN